MYKIAIKLDKHFSNNLNTIAEKEVIWIRIVLIEDIEETYNSIKINFIVNIRNIIKIYNWKYLRIRYTLNVILYNRYNLHLI